MRSLSVFTIAILLGASPDSFGQASLDQAAIDEARKHIDAKSKFYSYMDESRLGDDCGGYAEVYRLFILRTFSESEVIKFGRKGETTSVIHSIGRFKSPNTTIFEIDNSLFDSFKTEVQKTPFLSMEVWLGVWGVDTPKYHFEWCSAGNYYAVEREANDSELAPIFGFLENLVATE